MVATFSAVEVFFPDPTGPLTGELMGGGGMGTVGLDSKVLLLIWLKICLNILKPIKKDLNQSNVNFSLKILRKTSHWLSA